MQNPYDLYKKNLPTEKNQVKQKRRSKSIGLNRKKRVSKRNQSLFPMTVVLLSMGGLLISFYIFAYTNDVIAMIGRFDIGLTLADAAEEEKDATEMTEKMEKDAALPPGAVSQLKGDADHLTMKNANVYKALKDKGIELEKKERRLAQLEEELQKQKKEIEKQLKEMHEMRRNISSKLEQKEVADQESVEKLVGVYASMKPQNAAVVLSQLNNNLAVKVLGKMKKQDAAAILNYVEPNKAQLLSEMFTGLKK